MEGSTTESEAHRTTFATTHWSVVLAAAQGDDTQATAALEQLCHAYWYPLYAYIRRRGYPVADAEDLTQSFFLHRLSRQALQWANRNRGKFRAFMLGLFNLFLADELARMPHALGVDDCAASGVRHRLSP